MSEQSNQEKPIVKSQEEIAKELLRILKEERCPSIKVGQEPSSCILQTYPLALQHLIAWTTWGGTKVNRSFDSAHASRLEKLAKGHHLEITIRKIIMQCELEVQTKLLHKGVTTPRTEEIYKGAVLILSLLQLMILKKIHTVQSAHKDDK